MLVFRHLCLKSNLGKSSFVCKQAKKLMHMMMTPLPDVEQLTPRVTRILGGNPGPFTLQGTNSYLIGTGNKRILVDTGEGGKREYITRLSEVLRAGSVQIQEVVLTHWHHDHTGGVEDVFTQLVEEKDVKITKFPRLSQADDALPDGLKYNYVEDGHIFKTEGATLRSMYTPGHTDDHMSLYLEEENAIFTGDCVLGEGTAVFEDLFTYMKSLELILSYQSSLLYPAHGPLVKNPKEHLTHYISHRNERESQILQVLEQNKDTDMSLEAIVSIVYEGLEENKVRAACRNVYNHMVKLIKEDRVVCVKEEPQKTFTIVKSNL